MLAFPCNDFNKQEPGSNSAIKQFCAKKSVTFDLFAKIAIKGDKPSPLYKYLMTHPDESIAGDVAWNFQKYLVGRDGRVIAKWGPRTLPTDKAVIERIEQALAEPSKKAD